MSGLRAAKRLLAARVATDPRVTVYDAGRKDVIAGRLDVRVLAVILYLAERHGQVTISSLITGHRTYSRPGVVSAHVPGRALDVSAIGGVSVFGNQRPGGVVSRAVRGLLLLPTEVQAQQVISLFDLGGASFALADHADHVHIGFGGMHERGDVSRRRRSFRRYAGETARGHLPRCSKRLSRRRGVSRRHEWPLTYGRPRT